MYVAKATIIYYLKGKFLFYVRGRRCRKILSGFRGISSRFSGFSSFPVIAHILWNTSQASSHVIFFTLYCKKDAASLSRSRNTCVKHVRETRAWDTSPAREFTYWAIFHATRAYSLIRNKCRITKITRERTCICHSFHSWHIESGLLLVWSSRFFHARFFDEFEADFLSRKYDGSICMFTIHFWFINLICGRLIPILYCVLHIAAYMRRSYMWNIKKLKKI